MAETTIVLRLSTAHCPDSSPDFGPYRHTEHRYGFVAWLDDESLAAVHRGLPCEEIPEWLLPVLRVAYRHRATLIDFDRDVPVDPTIPTFDW